MSVVAFVTVIVTGHVTVIKIVTVTAMRDGSVAPRKGRGPGHHGDPSLPAEEPVGAALPHGDGPRE